MICKNCKTDINLFLLSGKDLYCPKCFYTIRHEEKDIIIKRKDYRPETNYEPDEEWIPDMLEEEAERKQKYEREKRQPKTKTITNYLSQLTLL